MLDVNGVEDRQSEREREEPHRKKKKHRSVVSTHADPSYSSQMQLETPGGAGVHAFARGESYGRV